MKNNRVFELMLDSNSSFFLIEANYDKIESALVKVLSEKYEIKDFYNNIDIRVFDSKDMQIADIKELIFEIGLKPFFNKKIIIFKNFEKIGEISQNAMLKSIEELSNDTIIIAICNDTIGILDTIKSRAYSIYLNKEINNVYDYNLDTLSKQELLKMFENKLEKTDILDMLENLMDSEYVFLKTAIEDERYFKNIIDINTKINKCYNYINSNCNRNLAIDLLLYRILEEK